MDTTYVVNNIAGNNTREVNNGVNTNEQSRERTLSHVPHIVWSIWKTSDKMVSYPKSKPYREETFPKANSLGCNCKQHRLCTM